MKNPSELIEEILSRVPPKVLVRFRAVSKQWNTLFDDKRFLNNHKMTFRFIIATESKIYSVSIDPVIVVRELPLGTPGLESLKLQRLVNCNELLLCGKENGAVVWNPWLGQSRLIEPSLKHPCMCFYGMVYDNKKYKMVAFTFGSDLWTTYDFPSDVWMDLGNDSICDDDITNIVDSVVSLNGILYCVCFSDEPDPFSYEISKFDFSSRLFYFFCNLPCGRNHYGDALVLRVFKEDRFSLLNQCIVTKKIEIWVTEDKINSENGDDVVWMNFMTFSSPNLPDLVESNPSYFIEDKRLVVCSYDKSGHTWIYILGENKLISKTRILDNVIDTWHLHCTFVPSLAPVPAPGKREELAKLQS